MSHVCVPGWLLREDCICLGFEESGRNKVPEEGKAREKQTGRGSAMADTSVCLRGTELLASHLERT